MELIYMLFRLLSSLLPRGALALNPPKEALVVFLLLSLLACFFGGRLQKLFRTLSGFLMGLAVFGSIFSLFPVLREGPGFVLALFFALLLALLSYQFSVLGMFVLTGGAAFVVGLVLCDRGAGLLTGGILCLLCGGASAFFMRPLETAATALSGGLLGGSLLLHLFSVPSRSFAFALGFLFFSLGLLTQQRKGLKSLRQLLSLPLQTPEATLESGSHFDRKYLVWMRGLIRGAVLGLALLVLCAFLSLGTTDVNGALFHIGYYICITLSGAAAIYMGSPAGMMAVVGYRVGVYYFFFAPQLALHPNLLRDAFFGQQFFCEIFFVFFVGSLCRKFKSRKSHFICFLLAGLFDLVVMWQKGFFIGNARPVLSFAPFFISGLATFLFSEWIWPQLFSRFPLALQSLFSVSPAVRPAPVWSSPVAQKSAQKNNEEE